MCFLLPSTCFSTLAVPCLPSLSLPRCPALLSFAFSLLSKFSCCQKRSNCPVCETFLYCQSPEAKWSRQGRQAVFLPATSHWFLKGTWKTLTANQKIKQMLFITVPPAASGLQHHPLSTSALLSPLYLFPVCPSLTVTPNPFIFSVIYIKRI